MSYKRHRKKQLYEDWRAPVFAGVCIAYILVVILIEKQSTKKPGIITATLSEVKQSSRIRNDNTENTVMMTYNYDVFGAGYHYYDYVVLEDGQLPDSLMTEIKNHHNSLELYYNPDFPEESSPDATLCLDPPVKNLAAYFLGFILVAGTSCGYLIVRGEPKEISRSGSTNGIKT